MEYAQSLGKHFHEVLVEASYRDVELFMALRKAHNAEREQQEKIARQKSASASRPQFPSRSARRRR